MSQERNHHFLLSGEMLRIMTMKNMQLVRIYISFLMYRFFSAWTHNNFSPNTSFLMFAIPRALSVELPVVHMLAYAGIG